MDLKSIKQVAEGIKCRKCKGEGKVWTGADPGPGGQYLYKVCNTCAGAGYTQKPDLPQAFSLLCEKLMKDKNEA